MTLKWIDSREIAIALIDKYPDINPLKVRFTDLYEWILLLDEFNDDLQHCNERILEAIQTCWIEEMD
ncbi:Fe-S cluster assembly protein IscX [uncultured Shewanella sp.]|uniref:Fe-S cluster assembly protein IscX n=1 Tax=uncultured Shewanella sp. TaxID=173975 RepID=UPI00260197EE|nr:Fe-S cluster assembly protein IscX [uncultured Shewanella sp.]